MNLLRSKIQITEKKKIFKWEKVIKEEKRPRPYQLVQVLPKVLRHEAE